MCIRDRGYVGLPATGKLRVDGGSGISRDCRAESVGFNVGGIDQSNFDPERGTVKGISKAVILMPEVSGIEVVPDPFSEAGRELFFLAVNFQPDLQVVIFLEKKGLLDAAGTVSDTHLDVYKRQLYYFKN